MLLTRSSALYAAFLISPLTTIASDEPAKIYDLSEVFGESWLNIGAGDSSGESSSVGGKVIMRGFDEGGMFWNTNPIPCGGSDYELGVDLYLNVPDSLNETSFEGMGLWIIDSNATSMKEIKDSYLGKTADRDLFNYRTDYVGYGTFFSVVNRKKIIKPSISVLFNDGTTLLPKNIPTQFGLYFNYTQIPQIQLNMSVKKNHIITRAKTSKGDWKKISGVAGGTEVCGYLGISSSNKRNLKPDDSPPFRGADLLFVNATLTTTDQNLYHQMIQEAHPKDELPKLLEDEEDQSAAAAAAAADDDEKPLSVLEPTTLSPPSVIRNAPVLKSEAEKMVITRPREIFIEHQTQPAARETQYDYSKLENLLNDLNKKFADFEANHKKLNLDLKALAKTVGAESQKNNNNDIKRDQQNLVRQQRVDALFGELKDLIKKSGESRAINIADTHKSFEDLQANAASLESTVRMASTYSTYLAAGLFVSFLVFGGVIYKRMKDMEKKHFL